MTKPSSFSKRLDQLLTLSDISRSDLARKTGISKSSITHYLKGDWEAKQDKVYAIAKAMNVSEAWLMGYDVPMERTAVPQALPLPSNLEPLGEMKKIPLIGTIACGTPILAVENIEEFVDLPRHIRADYALTCKGDSMIGAEINDGDIVYIREQPQVEPGQIAAVLIDDEATLKRFYQDGEHVYLMAENPKFRPLVYTGEEINQIRIIGLAVAHTRRLV